jgi:hypothetical protein
VISVTFALRLLIGAPCSSDVRAMIPPSPSLSARMTKVTYLMETTIVIDQNTSDTTP